MVRLREHSKHPVAIGTGYQDIVVPWRREGRMSPGDISRRARRGASVAGLHRSADPRRWRSCGIRIGMPRIANGLL